MSRNGETNQFLPKYEKLYDREMFWCLVVVVLMVALATVIGVWML